MENTIKLLSHNKECRVVITNTAILSSSKLSEFDGTRISYDFLKTVITNSVLFAGANDFNTKVSFNFKINKDLRTYCVIQNKYLRLEYSPLFKEIKEKYPIKFDSQSTLSITEGDFSGLHTSTVLASGKDVSTIFNFFSRQSEQLPTEFLLSKSSPSIGVLVQPLPFASIDSVNQLRDTLSKRINQSDFSEQIPLAETFGDVGKILWVKKVE